MFGQSVEIENLLFFFEILLCSKKNSSIQIKNMIWLRLDENNYQNFERFIYKDDRLYKLNTKHSFTLSFGT